MTGDFATRIDDGRPAHFKLCYPRSSFMFALVRQIKLLIARECPEDIARGTRPFRAQLNIMRRAWPPWGYVALRQSAATL